jgi:hypothetical protein
VFSGSFRSNLDPFSQAASDADVWGALRQAGLDALVRSMGVSGRVLVCGRGGGPGGTVGWGCLTASTVVNRGLYLAPCWND